MGLDIAFSLPRTLPSSAIIASMDMLYPLYSVRKWCSILSSTHRMMGPSSGSFLSFSRAYNFYIYPPNCISMYTSHKGYPYHPNIVEQFSFLLPPEIGLLQLLLDAGRLRLQVLRLRNIPLDIQSIQLTNENSCMGNYEITYFLEMACAWAIDRTFILLSDFCISSAWCFRLIV